MRSLHSALLLSFLERYTTTVVYAVSNIVLSRLLTPHETGLFTVGFALTVMIGTFRDFGVATYVIQEPDLTDQKWRSTLGVSAITSGSVFSILIGVSVAAGDIYHDANVTKIMLVSGLTLLLIPFNALILTWLRREMRYGALYKLSLTGALTQTMITVALAWAGYGAMSMAWGSVANSFVILFGSIRLRPRQFGYRPSLQAWRPIASLGIYSTIGNLCDTITPNGADLFIGRFAGLTALGQFSKGASLVAFVNQGMTSAILPVILSLFAQKRRIGEPLDVVFPQALCLLTGLTWPTFAGLSVITGPAIRLLFGPQWNLAIAPASIVVFSAMITSMTAVHAVVYQATGAMRTRMIVQLAITPAQLSVLFVAAHGTLVQAALGTIASAAIEYLPSQIMVNRLCASSMEAVVASLWRSAVVACCTAVAAFATFMLPITSPVPLLTLALAVVAGIFGWVVGLVLTRHPLGSEAINIVKDWRSRSNKQ